MAVGICSVVLTACKVICVFEAYVRKANQFVLKKRKALKSFDFKAFMKNYNNLDIFGWKDLTF